MRIILGIILSINLYGHVGAQNADSTLIRIDDFPRRIHLYTKIGPSFSQVEISNPDLPQSMLFKPNPQSLFGFGFSYSWLSLGFSFLLPADPTSEKKYGKTEKYDFEAHYTMRKLVVDLTVKNYRGFYFSNPQKFMDSWESGDNYPLAPNLATVSLAASFNYIFSPSRYSSNAAYTYTKAMRKSGGSWMLGGFFSINAVAADSSIIPAEIKQYVDPKFDLKTLIFSNIGLSFGYSHLFTIHKKYFVSFTLLPGLSVQKVVQQSSIDGTVEEFSVLALRNISRFSIGKNGDKFYWGISTYIETSIVDHFDSQLALNSGHTEIFLGYRLDTSNWRFMKTFDKIMHPRFLRFITGEPPER